MKVVALAGGVGGAKLADGLAQIIPSIELTIVVNVGDDFDHYGLRICPDIDTVCYTLAGIANQETGWGRANETWKTMESVQQLKGETWFRLGDLDLGTHLERTRRLLAGKPLSQITKELCSSWKIHPSVLPVTDDPVPTIVLTNSGKLSFQKYFVEQKCEPEVTGFEFQGAEQAVPAPGVLEAICHADLVVICPSNPWVSIDPILAIPGVRQEISSKKGIAVSPIIGGRAVKGPAAKMFTELGISPSAASVAEFYKGLITEFVLDEVDAEQETQIQNLGMQTLITNTYMKTREDRRQLAKVIIEYYEKPAN